MDITCVLSLILEYLGDPIPLVLVCSDWYNILDKWGMNMLANLIDNYDGYCEYTKVKDLVIKSIREEDSESYRLLHLIPNVSIIADRNVGDFIHSIYDKVKGSKMVYILYARRSCHTGYILKEIITLAHKYSCRSILMNKYHEY